VLSREEIAGLKLFIDDGQCISCHNGPLFTNFEFHNTGVLAVAGQLPPMGRYDGIRLAREDEFNCLSDYSDAQPEECIELRFAKDDNELVGAQKTPSLRNITETAPYMHGGQIADLTAVMQHYNDAPTSMLSHNEAKPLGLRPVQLSQLVAFMQTLTAPLNVDPGWLVAPSQ
jgi:cytochrome c peroxidase